MAVLVRILGILALLLCTPARADVVTEERKMINMIGINADRDFGYMTLFNRDTADSDDDRCGNLHLLRLSLASEEDRMLFSTLVAAKTGSRAVTVTFDRDRQCRVLQAYFQ